MLPKQESLRGVRRFTYFAILGFAASLAACGAADNIPTGGNPDLSCSQDSTCSTEAGAGSICLSGTCSNNAAACDPNTLVVVQEAFSGALEADLANACHFRQLDEALLALGGATRLIVMGDQATASSPIVLPKGFSFEGRSSEPSRPVELNIANPAADTALLTISEGSLIQGFALDGAGFSRGILVQGSQARLLGPVEISETTIAVELTPGASLTAEGVAEASVRLRRNGTGIIVPDQASLTMNGDGATEGLVIEDTFAGGGLVLLNGGADSLVTIRGLLARGNNGSDGALGTGAIEMRRGRRLEISDSLFLSNRRAINLNGQGVSQFDSFAGLTLKDNLFETSGLGQESIICGSTLGSVTRLTLEPGNKFNGIEISTFEKCESLESNQAATCEQDEPLGFTASSESFDLACEALP